MSKKEFNNLAEASDRANIKAARGRLNASEEDYVDLLLTYCEISEMLIDEEKFSDAAEYSNKALEISKGLSVVPNKYMAYVYNAIGRLYNSTQDYENGLKYFSESLEICKKLPLGAVGLIVSAYCGMSTAYGKLVR